MVIKTYPVVSAHEMRQVEKASIAEGCSEKEYIQTVAQGIAAHSEAFCQNLNLKRSVLLLVGCGNNGADALATGVVLLKKGFSVVAYIADPSHRQTPFNALFYQEFLDHGGTIAKQTVDILGVSIILDGIFGVGFSGKLSAPIAKLIQWAQKQQAIKIAIDVPSGMNADTGEADPSTFQADYTIFLSALKWGMFVRGAYEYLGKLLYVDVGIPSNYMNQIHTMANFPHVESILQMIPKRHREAHKYEAGYVLILAGSVGMAGAASLSSLASLRAGAGIVRLFHSAQMALEVTSIPAEVIKQSYEVDPAEEMQKELPRASATLIGPGLGREENTKKILQNLLPKITTPMVIDGDALFLLKDFPFETLNSCVVLTPHLKEMLRLLHQEHYEKETFYQLCQKFVDKRKVFCILKGAPTFVFIPGEKPYVLPFGNEGMATAGSGDVLSGIIASLLAQKLTPEQAALFGVYLHAESGDIAAKILTKHSIIASDLIHHIPTAYREIEQMLKHSSE